LRDENVCVFECGGRKRGLKVSCENREKRLKVKSEKKKREGGLTTVFELRGWGGV